MDNWVGLLVFLVVWILVQVLLSRFGVSTWAVPGPRRSARTNS